MRIHRVSVVTILFLLLVSLAFAQPRGRTEHFRYTASVEGRYLGGCGDFDLLHDFVLSVHELWLVDKDGQPVRAVNRFKVIGQGIVYNSTDPDLFLLTGPGEVQIDHWDAEEGTLFLTGPIFKITLPGQGPIFFESGRLVIDVNTGETLSDTGHNDAVDLEVETLCECLSR